MTKRSMHLAVFALGTGVHSAGWRMENAYASNSSWDVMQQIARTAERGKFDLFFVADTLVRESGDHPAHLSRFEPTCLIAALCAVTRSIGLGATVSTSFSEPYDVARTFSSIDHMSGGRAAWNVVTTSMPGAAHNFGNASLQSHDQRYEIASEFVDVVRGLWDTWGDNAIVADRRTGLFIDETKVRNLDHKGNFFSVKGPLNIARSPQGHPLLIQAGGSPAGQNLSARIADLVFSVVQDPVAAKKAYQELKQLAIQHGRTKEEICIMPGVMPIIGRTQADARRKLDELQKWVTPANALTLVSQRLGHDISGYPLDGPVPEFPLTEKTQGFSLALLNLSRKENLTLRELYNLTAAARGHWVLCGTPESIADTLEEWFLDDRADGFMILPAYFPTAFDEFVDLVVPELQRRGLFRKEYEGTTLRELLGLMQVNAKS